VRCSAEQATESSGPPRGRSEATTLRAEEARLEDVGSVEAVAESEFVFSICPPHAALEVAAPIGASGHLRRRERRRAGEPRRRSPSESIGSWTAGSSARRPREAGTTRLYLSGNDAPAVAELFAGSALDARVVSSASAVKMVYAGWTKGSAALLLAIP
jgi:hypothetical protein